MKNIDIDWSKLFPGAGTPNKAEPDRQKMFCSHKCACGKFFNHEAGIKCILTCPSCRKGSKKK